METTAIIAAVAPLIAQYGPQLVKDIVDLVHKNQSATVEQINALIGSKLEDASRNDQAVIGG